MMKKVWLVLLAVVLVFGLAVLGCGSSSSNTDDGGGDGGNNFTSDLSGLYADLVKNQYADDKDDSRGLQAKFDNKALMNGKKILKGDEITLKIKFKLSKPLAYDLEIGFVDTTVGADEGYWRTLTWDKDDKADSMYKIDKSKLVADTEIEDEINLTAIQDASTASAAASSLVFECRDSWSKDPVRISFVSFLVIFGNGGTEPPPPPPPPPTDQVFDITVGEDTVQSIAVGIGGEVEAIEGGFIYTAETPNYQANYVCFSVDLGDLTLGEIGSVTFKAKGIKGDTNHKDLQLWAKKTPIPGAQWNGAPQIQLASPKYTTEESDLEFEINASKILDIGGESQLYFVIYWPMGSASGEGSYQITDIVFVEGDPVEPPPPPPPPPPPANENFFTLGPFDDSEKTWWTNGVGGADDETEFTEEILATAKYLIIAAHSDALGGTGGLQFAHQGGGNWGWKQVDLTGDWTDLWSLGEYGEPFDFFIVIDFSTIPSWDVTNAGGGAKIILNSPAGWVNDNFVITAAYITSEALEKPVGSVDMSKSGTTYGWFAAEVPEMGD
jgi:hypothetical protein